MAIKGYVTEGEIVTFMQMINEDFELVDINELIVNAMYELINNRMDTVYEEVEQSLLIDGRGERFIFCSKIPIVKITGISTIALTGIETSFIINGQDRNIWWDTSTGKIWTDRDDEELIEVNSETLSFPDRAVSVRVNGTFGTTGTELVKQLQLMLILKQYSLMQPSAYASDIISEKIGRYEYKLANASNVAPGNQRKGIDGWISFLFEQLPSEDTMGLESV